jgi:hypothetical protein
MAPIRQTEQDKKMYINENNLSIIVGHYGSGKTEFAANYALQLRKQGGHPTVADLDIVNPYFRLRELREYYQKSGIRLISSNYEEDFNLDMPALAASLRTCFESDDQLSIIDVGGDPAGANVLATYSKLLANRRYNMWITVNANRPKTTGVEGVIEIIAGIQHASTLKINGIINTTHMMEETTKEDIKKGDDLVKDVSEITGIPVVYTVIEESLLSDIEDLPLAGERFPIKLIVRPKWL